MNPEILINGAKLTPFLLPQPAETGVLVVPGGGYGGLATGHEGHDIAAWLNERGYDAWMLEYSTASTAPTPLYPKPQDETLAALRSIRATGRVQKLGIWGFSAGGHLSATTVTNPEVLAADAKLDFGILCYPVISLAPGYTHGGSRKNLIGENPDPDLEKSLSAQNRVTAQTPPIFLFHTTDDGAVPVANALIFASALATHEVSFEMHIYEHGHHGVGLAPTDPILSTWAGHLETWLANR